MEQSEQQEQDARDKDRAAGQHDPEDGEHRAGNQEHSPPAGSRGVCEPHRPAGTGRRIWADVCGRIKEHPGPLLLSGHQILGNVLVPCLQDNRLTLTRQDQMSPGPLGRMACLG